ncbi:FGGY family carbohydrate kinase [Ovoidimarina sediminis]|uniref:FGGY family carbohydrate kinase n=1 Tax=Ovoidimarina sediminis TaxID=3079856 RepID=UPI00290A2008|nr:FGGY-family carbohydrate kinase [Rhodophyticola sp. MJ-SS7]MDU8943625.1 FGGY-family carbohydrate kinase [Rhodophyticola sp. MJ-SS7]
MPDRAVLAVDEGTTNSKAVLVRQDGAIIASGSAPVPTSHPQPGWVEQDADAIWAATRAAVRDCLAAAPGTEILALGISNQRESVLIWDRATGDPLGPVITWQCRRTAPDCARLRDAGHEAGVIARTGLPIDPLFPPTKAAWLLGRAQRHRDICIGTVDSWLIWKFTGGARHATDRSNAARTQLFNLAEGRWDDTLCALFGLDPAMLPEVHDSAHVFGTTRDAAPLPDGIPIASAIGDSHAALFSHGAFTPGDGKATFGTGSSVMTTVARYVPPPPGITTTIAWSLDGTSTFAFEGNILTSASVFPWTAELLGLDSVDALIDLAQTVDTTEGVSLVPAHVGLGSPHWNSEARGLVAGLSFASGPAHVARAAAESMALQVNDVFAIMAEAAGTIGRLSVDGGASRNPFLMQMVADFLDHPVTPCRNSEASALGAAHLAGLATGVWDGLDALARLVSHDAPLEPRMPAEARRRKLAEWRSAVARALPPV